MAMDPVRVDPRTLLPPDDPVQLLAPDGTFTADPDWPVDFDDDQLMELFRLMVVAREVDAQSIRLQRQGQLGVYASLRGQEAAQIGSAFALAAQDWVFPSYREMGVALVRGLEPAELLHVFRGTWLGAHDPAKYRFGLITISIGTQALHAAGFAMAAKLDGSDVCAVCYMGDGATSEGDTHEAMNFAGVFGAPCVFFVQNNQYAISVPVTRQTRAPTIAHKAVGYGMPGLRCDGNDVFACYAAMRQALRHAREGNGPYLVEAVTYRMEAHTTSDDPTRYRDPAELEQWRARDPIVRFSRYLRDRGLLDDQTEAAVAKAATAEAQTARAAIYEAPHGDPLELFSHVYVDPPPRLREQRQQLRAELEREDA
jgi:2-oxoisovalerate dehydrogenase E1 component alpha subunit